VLRFVLDTNCIIDLEEGRPDSAFLAPLIASWKAGKIELAIVAVSASENQRGGVIHQTYQVFEEKLRRVGLSDAFELMPLGIWDVFYWGHFLWSDDEMVDLANQIRNVLFPGIPSNPLQNPVEEYVWRNQLCDVLVAWCCIFHEWGTLVTRDRNFHDNRSDLKKLGLNQVLQPKEALELVQP
jgi:hypothetical protein